MEDEDGDGSAECRTTVLCACWRQFAHQKLQERWDEEGHRTTRFRCKVGGVDHLALVVISDRGRPIHKESGDSSRLPAFG